MTDQADLAQTVRRALENSIRSVEGYTGPDVWWKPQTLEALEALDELVRRIDQAERERDDAVERGQNLVDALGMAKELRRDVERDNAELRATFRGFYDDVDRAQRSDNTGGDSAVSVVLWSWSEYLAKDAG